MKKSIMAAALGGFALLSGCSGQGDSRPVLMVSIEPQRYLLEQIAGPGYRVVTMLENGANPETFDPSMTRRREAEEAEAYFAVGTLPFEETIRASLPDSVMWLDTSNGIRLIYGTHDHSHSGEGHAHEHEADPHIWTSVHNASLMAGNMLRALQELNPDSAWVYTERYAALYERMHLLDAKIRARLQGGGQSFAVWHPSLSYFAAEYDLEQLSVGSESKEMSPKRVREVIDEARADSVRVFFFQQEYDSRQAESINAGIGSKLININPLSYDFEGQLLLIADELAGAQ